MWCNFYIFIVITVLRMPHVCLMCNATFAIVYVIRRHWTSCSKKQPGHSQTQVRTHRTPTKTSYMMNILILSMIKLHIYMYDKIAYKNQHKSFDSDHSSINLIIFSLLTFIEFNFKFYNIFIITKTLKKTIKAMS